MACSVDEQQVSMWLQRTDDGYAVCVMVGSFANQEDAAQQGTELLAFIEGWEGQTLH